ncbi:hypothetical protein LZ023_38965 (plasmid) [Pseudomonas silvicola]|nr:hypothetical protein LZ023_38965 [Pseudomonas silvicola]
MTWGISPDQTCAIGGCVPDPQYEPDLIKQQAIQAALKYMGLEPGMRLSDIAITQRLLAPVPTAESKICALQQR